VTIREDSWIFSLPSDPGKVDSLSMDRTRLTRMSWLCLLALASGLKADVTSSIDAIVRENYLKNVEVGVKIVRLGDTPAASVTVYDRHGDVPFTPASNLKLATTSAALDTLGADFQFRTLLVQKGTTLALVGDGDPTLGDAELLKKVGWKSTTLFEKWAEALATRGLTKATGVSYDDGIFDAEFQHKNWPADQIHKRYVAGVSGLNFNANCLDFYLEPKGAGAVVGYRVDPPISGIPINNTCVQGSKNAVWLSRARDSSDIELKGQIPSANGEPISVTVNDPSNFAAMAFAEAFGRSGVAIEGPIVRDTTIRASIKDWTLLAVHETPIEQVLTRANKDSMNVYAESLFKRTGAKVSGEPGSWKNGIVAVGKYLESIGVPASQFSLDDGCGLSRKNNISPSALVTILQHQYFGKNRDLFVRTLAVAGVDGTLENRFDGTPLRERVFAKSGFIDGVSTLSGFAKGKNDQWYAFSILFNGIPKQSNSIAKKLQERIVLAIDAGS